MGQYHHFLPLRPCTMASTLTFLLILSGLMLAFAAGAMLFALGWLIKVCFFRGQ